MLSIKIKDIEFKNPICVASGTFGYGNESKDLVNLSKIGCIITKSVTLEPREGNPPPRIVETHSGMLNSIGLANVGINELKKAAIKSLSKNEAVWFGCDVGKWLNYTKGVMDLDIFDYEKLSKYFYENDKKMLTPNHENL